MQRIFYETWSPYLNWQPSVADLKNFFHWTITLYTATDTRYYAVDARTFEPVACAIIPDPEQPLSQRLERYLFPLRLRFSSWRTQLLAPYLNEY